MDRTPRTPTRDRILGAALEVFAGKGYHRAIVDDIVRASGTSKGAVYHHFPNKEAVFLALVDDFAERLALAVAAAVGERHGALAKVEGALTAALTTFADDERLARLILLEAVSLGVSVGTSAVMLYLGFRHVPYRLVPARAAANQAAAREALGLQSRPLHGAYD